MSPPPVFSSQFRSRYQLVRELGRGGMGRVFEAVQTALNRRVAIKVLGAEQFSDPENRQRFVDEARILARISHPNVVALYDADLEGGCPYLVMEFIRGCTLRQLLQRRKQLPLPEALEVGTGLLDGLGHLHFCGIAHRDLKPENILMENDTFPRLVDFGLARTEGSTRLTATGYMAGTPMFMAPEQFTGREGGRPADIYAFGMLLYHMLTGTYPIPMGNGLELLPLKQSLDARTIARGLQAYPSLVGQTAARCLAVAPEDRYPSPEAVANALGLSPVSDRRPVRPLLAGRAEPPRVAGKTTKKVRSTRWIWTVGVILAALVGLGIAFHQPQAARRDFAPAKLEVEPGPGASEVRWTSESPYPSRLLLGDRLFGAGGASTQHRIRVAPVPWATPPAVRIVFPDGSQSASFLLSSNPIPVKLGFRRRGPWVDFDASLPESPKLTVKALSRGQAVASVTLQAATNHRWRLKLPDALADVELMASTPGTGVLARESPPSIVPGPRKILGSLFGAMSHPATSELMAAVAREALGHRDKSALQRQVEETLRRLRFRERLELSRDAIEWALGNEISDRAFQADTVRALEFMLQLDQAALAAGIPNRCGVRPFLEEAWSCRVAPAPEGGHRFPVVFSGPRRVAGAATSQIQQYFLGDGSFETEVDLALQLPNPASWRQAWLTVETSVVTPLGSLQVSVNPGHANHLDLLFPYDRTDRPSGPVAITHAFRPACLAAGKNSLRFRHIGLPGTFSTSLRIHSVVLTVR